MLSNRRKVIGGMHINCRVYAASAVAREGQCLPVHRVLTVTEAASLPEAVFTVWSNIFGRSNLRSAGTLLIYGGSSGIGIGVTAIQIAKAWNCMVFVMLGTDQEGVWNREQMAL